MKGKVEYCPVGICIYCRSAIYSATAPARKLAEEHIVTYGLGGTLVLPEASCQKCEAITSSIEGHALRKIFGPLRQFLGAPTRNPKDKPDTLPLSVWFNDSPNRQTVDIPLNRYPYMVCLT